MSLNVEVFDEPNDRLTALCAAMVAAVDTEENQDVRMIVLLNDGTYGGAITSGYEEDDTHGPILDLMVHVQAMFEAAGYNVTMMPMGMSLS